MQTLPDDVETHFAITSTVKVDHVEQWWIGCTDATDEVVEWVAENDAVVVALVKTNDFSTQEVDGGNDLHSNVLAD